jgi:hypothetical protein
MGRRICDAMLILIISLLLLEGALWVLSACNKSVYYLTASPLSADLPDPILGRRLNPDYPGHDKDGFRNAGVLSRADMVALGDSQTYGTNVSLQDAWPQQVGMLSGRSVYNLAVPGYGPVQSLVLTPRALDKQPRWVVSALYDGNDLFDAFHMVYTENLRSELGSTDAQIVAEINRAQAAESIESVADRLSWIYGGDFGAHGGGDTDHPSMKIRMVRYFKMHCKSWNAARSIRSIVLQNEVSTQDSLLSGMVWKSMKKKSRRSSGYWIFFERGNLKTVFMPSYRLLALRLEDSRIREGMRISEEAMKRMSDATRQGHADFSILMIPTKELVYYEALSDTGDATIQALGELAHRESAFRARFKQDVCESGIRCIDPLPALSEAVRSGKSPYPMDSDGHPNRFGQSVIAGVVWHSIHP